MNVRQLGEVAGPRFAALRPAVSRVDEANAELKPLAEIGEPILRTKLRPFARDAQPVVDDLLPAARNLSKASPDLRDSFFEINRFFNMGAYNPGGREGLTGDAERGPRAPGGTPLLARMGLPQLELAVQHG